GQTDARSDVYALGATLYTLLTNRTPPESVAMMADSGTQLPLPRQLNPAIRPLTEQAILQAMALSKSQRLQTAEAFRTALQPSTPAPLIRGMAAGRVTAAHLTNGLAAPAESATSHSPSRPWPLMVLVGLAALALLAWGVWALIQSVEPEPIRLATVQPAPTGLPATVAPSPNTPPASTAPVATEPVATEPAATARPTLSPTPALVPGQARVLILPDGTQVEQVYAPAGSFLMGRDDGLEEDERPAHPATLDGFWIDRTEVTNAQFAAFVADTSYQTTAERRGGGETLTAGNAWGFVTGANWQHPRGPSSTLDGQEFHPVVLVTWEDADAFCRWRGGRLPTEAEWEYAARGPDSRQFPWGDFFETSLLNYCDDNCPTSWSDSRVDDGYAFTAPVGSYPGGASWIGALDLIGNVYEWVNDWFDEGYYARSPAENPTGPTDGGHKVQRGGSWRDYDDVTYAAYRFSDPATTADFNTGFRCASTE
ncbi:SUMF1/EgtB/PvdO family nonheme iron enzyme, partial [Promineifilum sp.]|uniref:SUMF1/EgtB/PvdO family nonheme iron enzyme n=1 Tax=Promineifilum sp. TaxID=2664178 RepID=UPI0035B3D71C